MKRELFYALDDERFEGRIVPLVAEPCTVRSLSWTLNQIQRIELTDFDGGCVELLRIWGIGYRG